MELTDIRMIKQAEATDYICQMRGKYFRHFKGGIYKVLAIGVHSETAELMVIYSGEYDTKIWIRPLDMFLSEVDHEKYPDVKQKMRFEPLDD